MASTKSRIEPNFSGHSSVMVNMVDLLKDWKFQPQVPEHKHMQTSYETRKVIRHVQTEGARAYEIMRFWS